MATRLDKEVLSSDGKHQLKGVVFRPDGKTEIKGLFHAVHGMTEYIGRYEGLLAEMADQGYFAFGYDHLGHGKTAESKEELGFIAHRDGWKYLVADVSGFEKAIKEEYGINKPLILFGHSMGSFIVRLAAPEAKPDKLIVMGTGGPNPIGGIGLFLAKTIRTFKGEKHISPFFENLAFGAYNKPFADENDSHSWLTKDKAVRDAYDGDPFCNYHFTISAYCDLMELNNRSNKGSWFKNFPKEIPVQLLSGDMDPVGNFSKGVNQVEQKLKDAGKDVRKILYEGYRHEILNDSSREQVISDMQAFCAE